MDGDIADWRLVRWNDLAGAGSLVRGPWRGPGDVQLRFALAWSPGGLAFAAELADDLPTPPRPSKATERVTLAIGSVDSVVQRYWQGATRCFRVGADGRLEAWTDHRNRRREPFEASALGVQVASRQRAGSIGAWGIELVVPWGALFPLLPTRTADVLVDVVVEDVDDSTEKMLAWSARDRRGDGAAPWSVLELVPSAATPAWIVAASSRHPEGWLEWSLASGRAGATKPGNVEVRLPAIGATRATTLRAALPAGERFRLRLGPLPATATSAWPQDRRIEVALQLPGDRAARRFTIVLPTDVDAIALARESTMPAAGAVPAGFPGRADAAVRLDQAAADLIGLGDWAEQRFLPHGLLAHREAALEAIDRDLTEAADLRVDRSRPAKEQDAARARLAARYPRRGAGGLPAGEPYASGYVSILDGTAQPYILFVPEKLTEPAPLLVALHDVDQEESTLLDRTALAAQAAERGWIVLCPRGRGSSGSLPPGERDVLDAIADIRQRLPVDGRRLYLTGLGRGGTGAWLVALRHPNLFAAANIVSAYGDFDQPGLFEVLSFNPGERPWYEARNPVRLVRKDMTTAFRIAHGERDAVVSPLHARILHARFDELGIAHEYRLDPEGDHGTRFFDDDLPAAIAFLAKHARREPGGASLEAFGSAGPPIADMFARGPFAIVYAPEDAPVAEQLAADWNKSYGGRARLVPVANATPEMGRDANLVLLGTPATNALLARWEGRLPVRYDTDAAFVGSSAYPLVKYGVLFAARHPEYPGRSLVVMSGMRDRLGYLPRSPFAIGAGYAIVSHLEGIVRIGDFPAP